MICKCGKDYGIFRDIEYTDKDGEIVFIDTVCQDCHTKIFEHRKDAKDYPIIDYYEEIE